MALINIKMIINKIQIQIQIQIQNQFSFFFREIEILLFFTTDSVPSSTKKLTTEKCKQQAKMHQNKIFRQIQ